MLPVATATANHTELALLHRLRLHSVNSPLIFFFSTFFLIQISQEGANANTMEHLVHFEASD